jgi:acetylornithine deacetylase/succinyl-diaminopimelate desuccinylase-like protein
MQDVIAYVDANRGRFVDDLVEWVRIPSVSSDPKHAPDVAHNAEHLAATLRALGAGRVEVWPTAGHPAVFAE